VALVDYSTIRGMNEKLEHQIILGIFFGVFAAVVGYWIYLLVA
jgi:hypothetical protein